MSLIRNLKEEYDGLFACGVFDSKSLFQGEMPVELYLDEGATEEDGEKCIEHYNRLLEKQEMLDALQSGLEKFFLYMYDEWEQMDIYEDIFTSLKDVMDGYKSGKQLVSYLSDPRMCVWPQPENETGYGIVCECPWEPEHQCLILIRNDKIVYVGTSEGNTPWDDEDEYYCIWNDEEE
jgi:hypothetical protein